MKKLVFIALLAIGFTSCTDDDTTTTETLTQTEIDDLQVLREEEKLARDVYIYAFDKYGLSVFNNISQSEQQHMDKILVLLNTYNLEDPALSNNGEFTNQTLQTLYNDLTAQVDISLIEALKVGATIEDLDINDIEVFESRTDKSDILDAYDSLKCGSRNHMRSYYSQLLDNGFTYTAQFITASELISIITSSNEQCGR
jgi:hypothetical protein